MSLLSPSVNVKEIDLSLTVSSASSSFGCFAGIFRKGPADGTLLITNVTDLERIYGYPNNSNYNQFFQCYGFLRNGGGSLYVARVIDRNGKEFRFDSGAVIDENLNVGASEVQVSAVDDFYEGQTIMFGEVLESSIYTITEVIEKGSDDGTPAKIKFTPEIEVGDDVRSKAKIYICKPSANSVGEVLAASSSKTIDDKALERTKMIIANDNDFTTLESSIKFSNNETMLKFLAKNPGDWGNDIRVGVANPVDFANKKQLVDGIYVEDNFQYAPEEGEVAIIVMDLDTVVESFICSLDPTSKDYNGKSNYIEDVINRKSDYLYCKHNTALQGQPQSALGSSIIKMKFGEDGSPNQGDVADGYNNNFLSKEEIDVDIVIGNELCAKQCADFCKERGDVIGFIGSTFDLTVVGGVNPSHKIVNNLVDDRQKGIMNIDNKYVTYIGNYGKIYDKYNDKYRWINLAGNCAGLRAGTNEARQPWFAAAGLNQGQLVDIIALAFNPNQGQRDLLYKNAINPVVSFPSQGICLFGQKTLTQKPSAFDRVNVRMLFNYLERNIANSARYILFEQNDVYTQNQFKSMTEPLLAQVKAKRGIDAFKVICDDTNNTPLVKSNNQFVASFLIKPTYAIEFITLNFAAVGATISFEEATGMIV